MSAIGGRPSLRLPRLSAVARPYRRRMRLLGAAFDRLHFRRDALRRRYPRQRDARRIDAGRRRRRFLRIGELTQRFQRARRARHRQQRIGRCVVHAQRTGALGEEIRRIRRDVVAVRIGDARTGGRRRHAAIAEQHRHVRRELLQRLGRHDRERAARRIRRRQRDHEFLRRLQFAHDARHAAAGTGQRHFEHAHAAARSARDGETLSPAR